MAFVNRLMTWLMDLCFAPFVHAPGWLSLGVFSAATAVFGLIVYKYTSNQRAIKRTKDRIKANVLAIKLFRDDLGVIAGSLARVCWGALVMLRYSLPPLAVMIVPFVLVLAQLALRYQWRPLTPGESAVVTARLSEGVDVMTTGLALEVGDVVVEAGPVRVPAEGRVLWRVRAQGSGTHLIRFRVGAEHAVEKSIDVGRGFARVSLTRSRGGLWDVLLHPAEPPIAQDSPVAALSIAYPHRESWFYGADLWVVWLILLAFVFAYSIKPFLRVEF